MGNVDMADFGACTFSGHVSPFPAHFSGTEGIMQLGTAVVPEVLPHHPEPMVHSLKFLPAGVLPVKLGFCPSVEDIKPENFMFKRDWAAG